MCTIRLQPPASCRPSEPSDAIPIVGTVPDFRSSDAFRQALKAVELEHERQLEDLRSALSLTTLCQPALGVAKFSETQASRTHPVTEPTTDTRNISHVGGVNSEALDLAKEVLRDMTSKLRHPTVKLQKMGSETAYELAVNTQNEAKHHFELQAALGLVTRDESPNMSIASQQYLKYRPVKFIRSVTDHHLFHILCSVIILLNTVFLAKAADQAARESDPVSTSQSHLILSKCFSCWFLCEVVLRMFAYGKEYFSCGWNLFDLLVLSMDVAMIMMMFLSNNQSTGLATVLRSLRALRISKSLRILRLAHFVRELRMMVASIMSCGPPLVWSIVLFFFISFVFGVFLMVSVTSWVATSGPEAEHVTELRHWFGSLDKTLYTLFKSIFGGISWCEISDALLYVHWTNAVFFCFYVFFNAIAVMNIITGIFVDSAIRTAQNQHHEVLQQQMQDQKSQLGALRSIFLEADKDGSGFLTLNDFEEHLKHEAVRANYIALGIDADEAWGFFRLLDTDDSGSVCIEEFLAGCMRMKGDASALGLATLTHEHKRMARMWQLSRMETQEGFRKICAWQQDVLVLCSTLLGTDLQPPEVVSQADDNGAKCDGDGAQ